MTFTTGAPNATLRRRLGALTVAVLSAVTLGSAVTATGASAAPDDHWILAGDQAGRQLLALDPAVADWNGGAAVRWEWKPTAARGYSAAETAAFAGGNDFRVRTRGASPDQRLVLVDGRGLSTVAAYPSGRRLWAQVIPGNLHSIELLPDDNVAVAASTGGFVRVYAASQGPNAAAYDQFDLPDAHATLWDPTTTRLWVTGRDRETKKHILTALVVGGTPAAPTLREDVDKRVTLPSVWGHDVSANSQDPGKLWVTTNGGAYSYDKATRQFTDLGAANRIEVKAIGNQPSGQLVETMPDNAKNPKGDCRASTWCTDTVDFFGPDSTRTRKGAAFYKARILNSHYSVEDQSLRGKVWTRTRGADDRWAAAVRIDGNPAISRAAATASPDGTTHVFTLVPGSGVWHRSRDAAGRWAGSATKVDGNGDATRIAAATTPDGRLHLFTLVPGSGVWHRERGTTGSWATAGDRIDENGDVTDLTAAALPDGTTQVFTLLPGSGVWHRERAAAGGWGSATRVDTNGRITGLSATGTAAGTLHLFTLLPGNGVWHRERAGAQWGSAARIDTDGGIRALAASGWPGRNLQVTTAPAGAGVWSRTRSQDGTWQTPQLADDDTSVLHVYAAELPDGTLQVGKIPEVS
ncbi:DUF6528 family protein [Actinoplanes sp. NPDC051859]|uniref:DUF6528 family protein n=1 Tax=Actinoplanes sp. NPDC051859 TaxID=3363909 RepID=UPI00378FB292